MLRERPQAKVTVSIVSHGHGSMVSALVDQLRACPTVGGVIVTLNVPEPLRPAEDALVRVIDNETSKGFGANHNAAFRLCRESFFCVLNPDIALQGDPFPILLRALDDPSVALSAPLIVAPDGREEDSIRRFPTLFSLARKAFDGPDGRYCVQAGATVFNPDWVAGMFMLFASSAYSRLGGFDERYFLYYEDVDICRRVWQSGMKVAACPSVSAIHDARRDSRRNLRHLRWHLVSMARFFFLRRPWRCLIGTSGRPR